MKPLRAAYDLIPAEDPFWPLIEAALSGRPTAAELAGLERRLQADGVARRLYFDLCRVEADIHFALRTADADERLAAVIAEADSPIDRPRPHETTHLATLPPGDRRLSLPRRAVAWINQPLALALSVATITLSIVLLSLALWLLPETHPAQAPSQPTHPEFVARVLPGPEAAWSEATQQELNEGYDLYEGQVLRLESGTAMIHFDDGAVVRLFAPAVCTPLAADALQLESGEAFARVPPQAVGFVLETSLCRLIDLGTEFMVHCEAQGDTHVYVHDGAVDVESAGAERPAFEPIRLEQGQSLTIPRGGRPLATAQDKRAELRRVALEVSGVTNYESWAARRDAFRLDPDLIAYYDFQPKPGETAQLANIAQSSAGRLKGELGNGTEAASRPTWSRGRWPGKQALAFDGSKSQFVRIRPEEPIDFSAGMSIVVWLRFESEPVRPAVLAAQREGPGPFAFQLAAMGNGRPPGIQFLSNAGDGEGGGYSHRPADFGTEWQCLAVTSDAKETIFYRNGREVARAAGIRPEPSSAPISLGANFELGADQPAHPFTGKMDELALLARVLTAGEVSRLYQQGRP